MQDGRPRSEDPLAQEARRLLAAAELQQAPLRLIGGMGIRLLLGERMHPRCERKIEDLDFITTRKGARAVERLLSEQGWQPLAGFNALHGHRRLLFEDREGERKLDVFVERFEMCHTLPLAQRIDVQPLTLPAAELTMSKLQIVQLNAKDVSDLYALLDALQVAEHDEDAINAARIAELTGADWGLHHTFELNLSRLLDGVDSAELGEQNAARVRRGIEALQQALQGAPKTRGWRLRARIGERRRWYEEPEEAER